MQHLFFIAIVPPPPVGDTIRSLQEEFAQRFNSRKALDVLPHITLKPPFRVAAEESKFLTGWFSKIRLDVKPFYIDLKGFDAFKNKRHPVIFVRLLPNSSLYDLHEQLNGSFHAAFPSLPVEQHKRAFTPHLTIAYRDLTKPMFEMAWAAYREKTFDASLQVDAFHLLKHSGRKWEIVATIDI